MKKMKMKQWYCKNNHILGFVSWNGAGLPQLRVLRKALDMQADHPDEVDLLGPLVGRMPIRCSICDDVKLWALNVESLVALLMQADDRTIIEVSKKVSELSKKVEEKSDPAPIGFATSPKLQRQERNLGEEEKESSDASV